MGLLEQIQDMKKKGKPESEIINKLHDQGVSPKAIQEAFNQDKIKSAISKGQEMENQQTNQIPSPSNTQPKTQDIENQQNPQPPQPQQSPQGQEQDFYIPQPQQQPQMQTSYQEQDFSPTPQQQQPQQEEYYPQQGYQGYGASSSDLMIEIAEQVFSEKMKNIQKQLDDLTSFANLSQTKMQNLQERLKRIESIIDKLQTSILEKVGSYGSSLENVKKEMSMMQDSFSKALNPLMDKAKHKTSHKKHPTKKKK